ncbi:PDZ domain-containing protein [Mycobacteroides salmoniphilum]|uniref:endopeptidase La n=1 Tax=Mycobacteroides salmoniphilum TaxID=404941 RepID=A0A4R8SFA7_9MYCO|nr:PDZ domain-containing protein [Mycobacteroides salmoniphilum]TDZ95469.1 Lon protease 2 [Mycobacteroides salmoniphilum]TEA04565.1 Lon protease 2 [Mycobacteroides salmoniphilum]
MNRRVATLLVALIPIIAFGLLMSVITVPFVSLGPGPTFNTLGQVEGKEVVDIKGTKVDPVSGHLNMTTVSQRDGLTLADALRLWASGSEQLVPRDVVYPPNRSKDQVDKENDLEFKKSEESAEFAALGYLKYPTAVTVLTISEDGPSKGKLQENDAITAVNGRPVATLEEFTGLLKQTKPGDEVTLDYKRKNSPSGTVKITLGKNGDRDYGFLGVGVVQAPWAPFTIDFNLANIGGPSAGLMFSLAVIDKLTPDELDGGKFVAGTGTIDAEGKVGPIGGITHKMQAAKDAGATVFLVPAANCAEAKTDGGQGLTLVKVGTLTEAVDGLNALNRGDQPPSC